MRIIIGVLSLTVLVVAAVFHGFALVTGAWDDPRQWVGLLFSILMASMSMLRKLDSVALRLLAITFTTFTMFNLGQWWLGIDSCGCFGRWSPSPWLMALIDTLLALALWWAAWPPQRQALWLGVCAACAGCTMLISVSGIIQPPQHLVTITDDSTADAKHSNSTITEDGGPQISQLPPSDEFVIVLVKSRCHRCRRLLDQLMITPDPFASYPNATTLIIDLEATAITADPRWPQAWSAALQQHQPLVEQIKRNHARTEVPTVIHRRGEMEWVDQSSQILMY